MCGVPRNERGLGVAKASSLCCTGGGAMGACKRLVGGWLDVAAAVTRAHPPPTFQRNVLQSVHTLLACWMVDGNLARAMYDTVESAGGYETYSGKLAESALSSSSIVGVAPIPLLERVASCLPHVHTTCFFSPVGISFYFAACCLCVRSRCCLETHASSTNIVLETSGPPGRRCLRAYTMRFSRRSRY